MLTKHTKKTNTGLQWCEKENKKLASSGELVQAAQTARLMSDIHLPQTKQNVNKCMAQQEK